MFEKHPLQEFPKYTYKWIDFFQEGPLNSCFQIYYLQQKLKYYLQSLRIFTGKDNVINLKIINLKIKIPLN